MGKIIKNGIDYSPTIHMPANTSGQAGAVAAGSGHANKVWGTDASGNPGWNDPAGGGHTIKNDSNTSLATKSNLQFKGTYSVNSGDNSVVNITRSMTSADYALLSADEKKGIIDVTDELGNSLTAGDVGYVNTSSGMTATDVQAAIDELRANAAVKLVTISNVSSLPVTASNAAITSKMRVLPGMFDLSNPASMGDNSWTVSTSNGSLTVSGTFVSGQTATNITLYLMEVDELTVTTS